MHAGWNPNMWSMTRIEKVPTAPGLAAPEEKEWNSGEHPVAAQAPLNERPTPPASCAHHQASRVRAGNAYFKALNCCTQLAHRRMKRVYNRIWFCFAAVIAGRNTPALTSLCGGS